MHYLYTQTAEQDWCDLMAVRGGHQFQSSRNSLKLNQNLLMGKIIAYVDLFCL